MRLVRTEEVSELHRPLEEAFERLRARRWAQAQTTAKERIARLERLKVNLLGRRDALADALLADFRKPRAEVESTELLPVLMELAHTLKNLKSWMKPRKAETPCFWLARAARCGTRPRVSCW